MITYNKLSLISYFHLNTHDPLIYLTILNTLLYFLTTIDLYKYITILFKHCNILYVVYLSQSSYDA